MSRQIKVTIDKVGRPTIEVEGFVGTSCKEATKGLEELFTKGDAKATDIVIVEKDEMNMVATEGQSLYEAN